MVALTKIVEITLNAGLHLNMTSSARDQASFEQVDAAARAIVETDCALPVFSRDWDRLTDGARTRYRAMATAALVAAACASA